MLLAIDTATQVMSLALHDGRNLLAEHTWHTANNHTIELSPAIRLLLKQCNAEVDDVKVLAVCNGPGSYSGLRIGIAVAKGIASARHLPLVGVSSLDVLAAGQPHFQGALVAVVQAGRGRITVGRYQWRKGHWGSRGEPQLMLWEELLASIDGPAYITGEINEEGFEALAAAQGRKTPVTLAPSAFRLRRAGFLAEEAWTRYNADRMAFPAARLTPIYVKTPDTPEL
jgi:tRNA threonylcarbamoyladenosine biosynthesis protein TsaB